MNEPISTADRVAQQTEEITRDVLERASPQMITQAVDAALGRWQEKLAAELARARTAVTDVMDDFATKEQVNDRIREFGEGAKKELKQGLDDYLNNLNQENARRQEMFDQQVQQVLVLAQAADTRSIATQNEIAEMKGAYEQRFTQIEGQIALMRRDIDDNVTKMVAAANRMDTTFSTFVTNYERKTEKVEQDIKRLSKEAETTDRAIEDIRELRNEDYKEIRRIDGRVSSELGIVQDIDGRVRVSMERMENALYGDTKEKTPGLVADMTALKSGLAWQTMIGRHPRITLMVAGAAYVLFLIVTAFVLNRPEIVARMIPAGSGSPN